MIQQLLFSLFATCGAIHPISDIAEAAPLFDRLQAGDLAFFDHDMVLCQPAEPAFQMPTLVAHRTLWKGLIADRTPLELDEILARMVTRHEMIPVQAEMKGFIDELKERQVIVLGLTANFTGPFERVDHVETRRLQQLRNLGITFSTPCENFIFEDLSEWRGQRPTFFGGSLFCNGSRGGIAKGKLLCTFLKHQGWEPQTLLFIDDAADNLSNVEMWLEEHFPNCTFIGIHYTAGRSYPSEEVSAELFAEKVRQLLE